MLLHSRPQQKSSTKAEPASSPSPWAATGEIQTTTTRRMDAQKHELIRPQEFWTFKNRTPDLASTRNKFPQEQTSWEVKDELRVSRLCCFIPMTHHSKISRFCLNN
jgi:hypothetical protein